MDRRDFLKTTGAAAVAASTAPSSATATEPNAAPAPAAPAVLSGVRELTLASSWGADLPGEGSERLARRIEMATDGHYRILLVREAGRADLTYGSAHRHAGQHPAFGLFAGLPGSQGLEAQIHQTWLAAGGGDMLWEDLAAGFGFKPLVVGHTGPSAGVWAAARLESEQDLVGAALHADGLAADVVGSLGARPVTLAGGELRAAVADGRLLAAEWLGPPAAAAPDLQPLAQRLYAPGFNRYGILLSLAIDRRVWDGMTTADHTIFAACAAQEYQLTLADARAHAMIAAEVAAPAKWPVRFDFSPELSAALEQATAKVVEGVAATDAIARRIHDSYRAFRRMSGVDAIA